MGWAWEAHCGRTLLSAFPLACAEADKERGRVGAGGQEGGGDGV